MTMEIFPGPNLPGSIYVGTGSHAIRQTVQNRLRKFLLATDYDTFDEAVAAASGTTLYVPAGAYTSAGNLAPASGSRIVGENPATVGVSVTHATNPLFALTGSFITIEGLQIGATVTRTSTANGYINATSTGTVTIKNNYFVSAYNAIVGNGNSNFRIENNQIGIISGGIGILLGVSTGGIAEHIRENLIGGAGDASIHIASCGDVTLTGNQVGGATHGLRLAPQTGQGVVSIKSIGNFYDQSLTSNLTIAPNAGSVARCTFTSDWFSGPTTSTGVSMGPASAGTIKGVSFINCEFYLNNYGIVADATSGTINGILILGGFFAQNSSAGILLTDVLGGTISGALIGATGGFTANGTGISLTGTTDYIAITGNVDIGNSTDFSNTSSGTNSRGTGNIGIADF